MSEGPHTRSSDPDTSHGAADTLRPRAPSIRKQVLDFALERGRTFTDDELVLSHPAAPESSFRKRRSELTEENRIVDSRRRSLNRHENEVILWVHRDHARQYGVDPGPVRKRTSERQLRSDLVAAARAKAATLRGFGPGLRGQGMSALAGDLEEAAGLLERLTR